MDDEVASILRELQELVQEEDVGDNTVLLEEQVQELTIEGYEDGSYYQASFMTSEELLHDIRAYATENEPMFATPSLSSSQTSAFLPSTNKLKNFFLDFCENLQTENVVQVFL